QLPSGLFKVRSIHVDKGERKQIMLDLDMKPPEKGAGPAKELPQKFEEHPGRRTQGYVWISFGMVAFVGGLFVAWQGLAVSGIGPEGDSGGGSADTRLALSGAIMGIGLGGFGVGAGLLASADPTPVSRLSSRTSAGGTTAPRRDSPRVTLDIRSIGQKDALIGLRALW